MTTQARSRGGNPDISFNDRHDILKLPETHVLRRVEATAWTSDRDFFARNPTRSYRLRPAFAAEIEEFACDGDIPPLPDRHCWWIVVRQLHKAGMRMRWPFAAPDSL